MVSPLSLHLHPQLWLLSLCQRQRYLLFLALTSLLSYRLICLSGPISVCTNWNSLSLTPSLFSFPLFPSLVTLSSILLPTANKLSSLRESNSYNLETFHSFPPSAPPTLLPGAVPGSHSPSVKVASRRSREQVCVNTQMPLCPVGHHYPIELSAAMVIFYILLSNMIATSSVWLLSTWNVPGKNEELNF